MNIYHCDDPRQNPYPEWMKFLPQRTGAEEKNAGQEKKNGDDLFFPHFYRRHNGQ